MQTELDKLIAATKGKFFSITFTKNDGTERIINGKDKYRRLLNGGVSTLTQAGFSSFVDRNKENWASAKSDRTLRFKCGNLEKIVRF